MLLTQGVRMFLAPSYDHVQKVSSRNQVHPNPSLSRNDLSVG